MISIMKRSVQTDKSGQNWLIRKNTVSTFHTSALWEEIDEDNSFISCTDVVGDEFNTLLNTFSERKVLLEAYKQTHNIKIRLLLTVSRIIWIYIHGYFILHIWQCFIHAIVFCWDKECSSNISSPVCLVAWGFNTL